MHLFVYLVRHERPDDFRLFLARHAELLRGVDEWTIRIVLPRRFQKAKSLHIWALRDDLLTPVCHGLVDELDWYFRSKHGRDLTNVTAPDLSMKEAENKFGSARYRALERLWLQEGWWGISGIDSHASRTITNSVEDVCRSWSYRTSTCSSPRLSASRDGAQRVDNPPPPTVVLIYSPRCSAIAALALSLLACSNPARRHCRHRVLPGKAATRGRRSLPPAERNGLSPVQHAMT